VSRPLLGSRGGGRRQRNGVGLQCLPPAIENFSKTRVGTRSSLFDSRATRKLIPVSGDLHGQHLSFGRQIVQFPSTPAPTRKAAALGRYQHRCCGSGIREKGKGRFPIFPKSPIHTRPIARPVKKPRFVPGTASQASPLRSHPYCAELASSCRQRMGPV
jgi:hypothetical protein